MELTSGAQTQIAQIISEQTGTSDDKKLATQAIIEMIEKGQFDANTFSNAKMINPAVDAVLNSDQVQNSVKAALVNTVEVNQGAIDSISIAPSVASSTRVGTYSVPHAPEKDFTSGNRFFEKSSYIAVISILAELADHKAEIARAYDDFTGDSTLRLFQVARQDALLESERASKEIKEVYKTTQGALIQAIMAGVGLMLTFLPGSLTKVMREFKAARNALGPNAIAPGAATTGQTATIQPAQAAPAASTAAPATSTTAPATSTTTPATQPSAASQPATNTTPEGASASAAASATSASNVTIQPAQAPQAAPAAASNSVDQASQAPKNSPVSGKVADLVNSIKDGLNRAISGAYTTAKTSLQNTTSGAASTFKAGIEQATKSAAGAGQLPSNLFNRGQVDTAPAPTQTTSVEVNPVSTVSSSSSGAQNSLANQGKPTAPAQPVQETSTTTPQKSTPKDQVVSSNEEGVAPLKSPLENTGTESALGNQNVVERPATAMQPPKPKQDTAMVGAREKGEAGRDGLGSTQAQEPPKSTIANLDLKKASPIQESDPVATNAENPAATPLAHKESPQATVGSKMQDGEVSTDVQASDKTIRPDQAQAKAPPEEGAVKQEMQSPENAERVAKENPLAAQSNLGAQEQAAGMQPKNTTGSPSDEAAPKDRVSSTDNTPRIEPLESNEDVASASLKDSEVPDGAAETTPQSSEVPDGDIDAVDTRPAQETADGARPGEPSAFKRTLDAMADGVSRPVKETYKTLKEHDLSGIGEAVAGIGEQANQVVIAAARIERAQEEKELMRSLEMTKSYKNMLSQEVRSFRDESLNVAREFNSIIESIRNAAMQQGQDIARTTRSHSA